MSNIVPFRAPASPTHGTREPARPASSPGRADPDLPRYALLRDGGLMPDEPMAWWAPIVWGVAIMTGLAFWAYVGTPALFWIFDLILMR